MRMASMNAMYQNVFMEMIILKQLNALLQLQEKAQNML